MPPTDLPELTSEGQAEMRRLAKAFQDRLSSDEREQAHTAVRRLQADPNLALTIAVEGSPNSVRLTPEQAQIFVPVLQDLHQEDEP